MSRVRVVGQSLTHPEVNLCNPGISHSWTWALWERVRWTTPLKDWSFLLWVRRSRNHPHAAWIDGSGTLQMNEEIDHVLGLGEDHVGFLGHVGGNDWGASLIPKELGVEEIFVCGSRTLQRRSRSGVPFLKWSFECPGVVSLSFWLVIVFPDLFWFLKFLVYLGNISTTKVNMNQSLINNQICFFYKCFQVYRV